MTCHKYEQLNGTEVFHSVQSLHCLYLLTFQTTYYFYLFAFFKLIEKIEPPPFAIGCASNSDCPDYTACENRKCINPCAEKDPCARNAYCKVIRHKPVCTCPDGYIGDPTTSCELRKYTFLNFTQVVRLGNMIIIEAGKKQLFNRTIQNIRTTKYIAFGVHKQFGKHGMCLHVIVNLHVQNLNDFIEIITTLEFKIFCNHSYPRNNRFCMTFLFTAA